MKRAKQLGEIDRVQLRKHLVEPLHGGVEERNDRIDVASPLTGAGKVERNAFRLVRGVPAGIGICAPGSLAVFLYEVLFCEPELGKPCRFFGERRELFKRRNDGFCDLQGKAAEF